MSRNDKLALGNPDKLVVSRRRCSGVDHHALGRVADKGAEVTRRALYVLSVPRRCLTDRVLAVTLHVKNDGLGLEVLDRGLQPVHHVPGVLGVHAALFEVRDQPLTRSAGSISLSTLLDNRTDVLIQVLLAVHAVLVSREDVVDHPETSTACLVGLEAVRDDSACVVPDVLAGDRRLNSGSGHVLDKRLPCLVELVAVDAVRADRARQDIHVSGGASCGLLLLIEVAGDLRGSNLRYVGDAEQVILPLLHGLDHAVEVTVNAPVERGERRVRTAQLGAEPRYPAECVSRTVDYQADRV